MLKGLRVIPTARPTPYVCNNCRRKALRAPAPEEQRRWISRNQIHNIKTAEEEWMRRAEDIEAGRKISMLDLLEQRGYVNQIVGTRDQLNNLMNKRRVGAYCGVDPTAPSLHVGHMVPFMVLGWLYIHGYSVHFLLGGSTARIGDPTDRLKAREGIHRSVRKANMFAMHQQLKRLGESFEKHARRRGYVREWAWKRALVNNNSWYSGLPMLDFLSTIGSAARIGPMLGRDTVKDRLEKGTGMSFAEFAYPLVQAYDWWQLYRRGVQIQVGGADQFGNILAGAEMVKHMAKLEAEEDEPLGQKIKPKQLTEEEQWSATIRQEQPGVPNDPMGFTVPLLTTASGEKFGKSAGNAVWLDPDMTSSYDLYQFFLRSADADLEKYMRLLTFMPLTEIEALMEEHRKDESKRVGQHRLAKDFVELVHGLEAAEKAEQEHRNMFKKDLSISELRRPAGDSFSTTNEYQRPADINPSLNKHAAPPTMEKNMSNRLKLPVSLVDRQPLSKILWSAGLVASRSEGQRLINSRGVHIGKGANSKKGDMDDMVTYSPAQTGSAEEMKQYIIDGELLIIRIGKWKVKIISVVKDQEFEEEGLTCPGWMVEEETKEDEEYGSNFGRQEEGRKRKEAEQLFRKAPKYGVVTEASWDGPRPGRDGPRNSGRAWDA